MSSILTVNGTNYNQAARKANSLLVDAWGWDNDADWWLEFHEYAGATQPKFAGPKPVALSVSSTTVFTGDIVSVQPTLGELGYTWGYRCLGLQYRANWIPVTAVDGSGLILFDVNPTDSDNYFPAFAGQSVGQIISYCLTQHATALTAAGITTDATTASQLAAITLTPNEQVEVAGERLWQAMQSVLQRWQRNLRLIITPAGLVRVVDVTLGASHTLTAGTDPVDPPLFSRNWTNCATQVTVRGKGVIEPAYVSVLKGSFTPAWTSPEQSSWNMAAFTNPANATDNGTITVVNGPTQVTVKSSNSALTWATNFWPGIQAWIYCINSTGTGLTYTEARPITSCSSLSAGGTATINLGYALSNSGSSAYDQYQIIGTDIPPSSGGLADVWRLYNVTDPGGWIADHLVRNFPVDVPFVDYFSTSATLTSVPTCQIVYNGTAGPALFTVDPVHGQILFTRPVVEQINTQVNLALGGSHVLAPSDVYMLLAYSRGALETSYPSSGYSGTAYSAAGLSRTQFVDVETWRYGGNTSLMTGLAQMLQGSVSNTLMEGMVHYKGYYATVQDPSAGGHLLSFAGNGYTTGNESLNIPVRAATYRYMTSRGSGLNYTTDMRCSTRQDPRTGESYYAHLSQLGSGIQLKSYGQAGGNMQFGGSILPEPEADDLSGLEPTFSPNEIRAGNRASSRESNALERIQQDENRGPEHEAHAADQFDARESAALDQITADESGAGARRYQNPMTRKRRKAAQARREAEYAPPANATDPMTDILMPALPPRIEPTIPSKEVQLEDFERPGTE